jgi:hypothetical protein
MIGEPFCPRGGAPVAVALEISRARRVAATQRFITARVDGGVCGVRCRLLAPDVDRLDRVGTPARNGIRPVQQPQSICRQGMNRGIVASAFQEV